MKSFYKTLSAAALALAAFQMRAHQPALGLDYFTVVAFIIVLSPQFLAIYLVLRKKLKVEANKYALISIASVATIVIALSFIWEIVIASFSPTDILFLFAPGRFVPISTLSVITWLATAILLQIILWIVLFLKKDRSLVVWLSLISAIYTLLIPVIGYMGIRLLFYFIS